MRSRIRDSRFSPRWDSPALKVNAGFNLCTDDATLHLDLSVRAEHVQIERGESARYAQAATHQSGIMGVLDKGIQERRIHDLTLLGRASSLLPCHGRSNNTCALVLLRGKQDLGFFLSALLVHEKGFADGIMPEMQRCV